MTNNDPTLTGMLTNMVAGTFMSLINSSYEYHQRQAITQQASVPGSAAQLGQELLDEVSSLNPQIPANPTALSDSYKKGGFSK